MHRYHNGQEERLQFELSTWQTCLHSAQPPCLTSPSIGLQNRAQRRISLHLRTASTKMNTRQCMGRNGFTLNIVAKITLFILWAGGSAEKTPLQFRLMAGWLLYICQTSLLVVQGEFYCILPPLLQNEAPQYPNITISATRNSLLQKCNLPCFL